MTTKKKMSSANKATAVGGTASAVVAYAAILAQQKLGIPAEVAAPLAGGILAFVSRWAGKLTP